ncbi:hypothetical protein AURANDRAFT_53989 [Aureococcus anophagefferens]|uniref:UV excision repair protein RAD23 n=1 Tax=Aureococcus anophagefferens TaxID=44056 RepID=F0YBM6_AURAN|nr:hypothetical protein AURANDRAFT_53989 [Aureococcus anophagefferens]EGB07374.1 hypothetical protein AURANDRAFT_53989 [Aureococcus anophagefferens]|eukprot:XP_009037995.1 hypothetical protein AURANDRAFT_53989 [Aureococcus anophagefferens]
MLVAVKTLEGRLFKVEAAPESTIGAVKGLIEASQPELKAAAMKLIHSGKVLKDEDTLADKGVTEQSFLVCMVTKPKRAAAPKPAAAPAPAPAAAPAAPPPSTPAPSAPAPTPAPAPAETPAGLQSPAASPHVTAEALAQLDAMGFGHADQSRAALEAAMGNVDLAVEFLMNGIPDEAALTGANLDGDGDAAMDDAGASPLATLRAHPQFDDLRRTIQANPGALQQVLAGIGRDSPELLALIHANQAEFLQMMNEPLLGAISGGGGMGGGGRGPPGGGGGAGNVVRLTREEADAVGRLQELGFSRDDAVQAYLACDKNESLAANLLFDGFDSVAMGGGAQAAFPDDAPAPDGGGDAPAPAPGGGDDDDDMYS